MGWRGEKDTETLLTMNDEGEDFLRLTAEEDGGVQTEFLSEESGTRLYYRVW